MTNDFNYKELNNLTEEEKKYALKILEELSKNGSSKTYDNILYADYREIPVDIITFIHDNKFLGKALMNEKGETTVYPYWENVLKKIFPDPFTVSYNTAIFTGGIGLGKSTIADIGNAYQLYKVLCLKDPYAYYGLQKIDTLTIAFLNNTIDNAKDVAWKKFHSMLIRSDWFVSHGKVNKLKKEPEWEPADDSQIELLAGSSVNHIIGRCVLGCFIDEINFSATTNDIQKQKEKALDLVTSASIRMQSRFMKGTKNPTILFIASSKKDEQSFLETFIESKKNNDSKSTIIIDEPQWVIRTDKDSAIKFKVALGNKFLDNELVPLDATEDDIKEYMNKGYDLIDVPFGYYEQFQDDLDKALMEIAGRSTSGISKYLSGSRIAKIKTNLIQNAFTKDVIEVGNSPEDTSQYYDFFDMSRIPKEMMSKPMYIHLDMSISGDKTGIAGVWIKGKKPHKEGDIDSKELYYQLAFCVSIEAPKGYQISFEKNRQFIYWLRQSGFKIKVITTDTFQSADFAQSMKANHFEYKSLSVDRVNTESGVCEPYHYLKSTIYEERLILFNDCDLLTKELIGLEKDGKGKIDHSPNGVNSKDSADAVCGCIYEASQHAEEFAYDYGESLETIVDVSNQTNSEETVRQQISVDFEELLKQVQDPLKLNNSIKNTQLGFDKDDSYEDAFLIAQGIII